MMDDKRVNELIRAYHAGTLRPEEEAELERYIEQGIIELDRFDDLRALDEQLDLLFSEERSRQMRAGFQEMLAVERGRLQERRESFWPALWRRLGLEGASLNFAYGVLFLLLGTALGYLIRGELARASSPELARLSAELRDTREAMMLAMLKGESTTERLKAVNLTQEMTDVSDRVAEALLRTLNGDPNVNVRLAALDALYPYASNPRVRQGLIASIGRQQSPLVQMALAEAMTALQEKRSVKELQELLGRKETAPEVKDKIRSTLEVLM